MTYESEHIMRRPSDERMTYGALLSVDPHAERAGGRNAHVDMSPVSLDNNFVS
jgi:hypothetical protein